MVLLGGGVGTSTKPVGMNIVIIVYYYGDAVDRQEAADTVDAVRDWDLWKYHAS